MGAADRAYKIHRTGQSEASSDVLILLDLKYAAAQASGWSVTYILFHQKTSEKVKIETIKNFEKVFLHCVIAVLPLSTLFINTSFRAAPRKFRANKAPLPVALIRSAGVP